MPVGVQCPIPSSLGKFPSYWDWFWCPGLSPILVSIALPYFVFSIRSSPQCCGPRGGQRYAWSRKLDPNFCSGRGRTSDLGIRLARTPPFSRLLRHVGGYSRTILTPNLQGTHSQLLLLISGIHSPYRFHYYQRVTRLCSTSTNCLQLIFSPLLDW